MWAEQIEPPGAGALVLMVPPYGHLTATCNVERLKPLL